MVKLTGDLILQSAHFFNPLKERELDLRGNKIPAIENLGVTQDAFDIIDFSDNDVKRLEGFPLMRRLRKIFICNNRLNRIGQHLEQNLPALEELNLANNQFTELSELDPLATIPTLERLSLLRNPVAANVHYRLYVINKIPQLKILDYRKIKQKEREAAKKLFSGEKGEKLINELTATKAKTFVPGEPVTTSSGLTPAQVHKIKAAIQNASSIDEIQKLERYLAEGKFPEFLEEKTEKPANGDQEEEKDEDSMEQ
eukprot:Colp12_sorted_trinity150504_noHs@30536